MLLDERKFLQVIESTPLVAIDLIVFDDQGRLLLGRRKNEPAAGYWFTPGGRIRKNERLDTAFRRISGDELGRPFDIAEARFLGVFEHHYQTNVMQVAGISTHYVVLAFELAAGSTKPELPPAQHDQYAWFNLPDIDTDPEIHPYVREYFSDIVGYRCD